MPRKRRTAEEVEQLKVSNKPDMDTLEKLEPYPALNSLNKPTAKDIKPAPEESLHETKWEMRCPLCEAPYIYKETFAKKFSPNAPARIKIFCKSCNFVGSIPE